MTTDSYSQPGLCADKPRARVTITAPTYADLAPRAIELATDVLGPGQYAAAIVEPGPVVTTRTTPRGFVIATGVECEFEVGTEETP